MAEHLLLLGHPTRYGQFLEWLSARGFRVTLAVAPGEAPELPLGVTPLALDLIGDFEGACALIEARHRIAPFDGVFSHNEFMQVATDRVAERLVTFHRPPESIRRATHKLHMKELFAARGVPTAPFVVLDVGQDIESEIRRAEAALGYPMVVKPTNGGFSIGVTRVDGRDAFRAAIRTARRVNKMLRSSSNDERSRTSILVEKYVHGAEFTVDGFMIGGVWHPMASCEKYPDLFGPTFQENVYLFSPSAEGPVPADLAAAAEKAAYAFGVSDTPFHIEIRREHGTGVCHVVEAAPRMAGMGSTFYNVLLHATDFDAYELAVGQRLGRAPRVPALAYPYHSFEYDSVAKKGGRISRLRGLEQVLAHPCLRHADILKREGETLAPPEMNLETIAVFYFRTRSRDESMTIVRWIDDVFGIECTRIA
jgi:hypothetical protein